MATPDQPTYVTDTHGLIWYLAASPRLGKAAKAAFDQVADGQARLIVPAIVIAELVYVGEKRHAAVDVGAILQRLQGNPSVELTPLTVEVVLAMRAMPSIPEMHDRLIACEAKMRGAKVITRDEEIRKAGVGEVVW